MFWMFACPVLCLLSSLSSSSTFPPFLLPLRFTPSPLDFADFCTPLVLGVGEGVAEVWFGYSCRSEPLVRYVSPECVGQTRSRKSHHFEKNLLIKMQYKSVPKG